MFKSKLMSFVLVGSLLSANFAHADLGIGAVAFCASLGAMAYGSFSFVVDGTVGKMIQAIKSYAGLGGGEDSNSESQSTTSYNSTSHKEFGASKTSESPDMGEESKVENTDLFSNNHHYESEDDDCQQSQGGNSPKYQHKQEDRGGIFKSLEKLLYQDYCRFQEVQLMVGTITFVATLAIANLCSSSKKVVCSNCVDNYSEDDESGENN